MTVLDLEVDHLDFGASVARLLERLGADEAVLGALGRAGFLGVLVPEDLGGGGVDDPRFVAVGVEELCRAGRIGAAVCYALQGGVLLPLVAAGAADSVRAAVLEQVLDGEHTIGLIREPVDVVGGSPDQGWRLTGSAPAALAAEHATHLVVGFEDDEGVARVGVLDVDTPGLVVTSGNARALDGAGPADVELTDVVVTPERLLEPAAAARLGPGVRLWLSLVAAYGAQRALDLTLAYTSERQVFGQRLADLGNTRAVLARTGARARAARLHAEWCLARHRRGVAEGAEDAESAAALISAVEAFAAAADAGMQLHGGYGYILDYPISSLYADAQLLSLIGWSTQPLDVVADAVLTG